LTDPFFVDMGDKKRLSTTAMYRDIEFLDNCKAACTKDVDCQAIGYDMASTVCVLYGEKRKIRPPLWEILHGNGDQQQINGMIFLKVESALPRIPDNSLAVFIIGPPGITIILTIVGCIYGVKRWCQLRAKRKKKEKRRFERMLKHKEKKMLNLHAASKEKRADQKHGRLYRFGYGTTWSKGFWKQKAGDIVKTDREEIDHEDEFVRMLERSRTVDKENEPGNLQEEYEGSDTDDPDDDEVKQLAATRIQAVFRGNLVRHKHGTVYPPEKPEGRFQRKSLDARDSIIST